MKKPIVLTIILFTVQFLAPIFGQDEQKPELVVQTGHSLWVESVSFSPNGKLIASGGKDLTIKIWDTETGHQLRSFEAQSSVSSVAFSPDGKTLASGSEDYTVKLWNVESGQQIRSLEGHRSWVNSVAFSPDGKTLASGSGKIIELWSIEIGSQIKSLTGHNTDVQEVEFSPDGKTLASLSYDSIIKLWNVETGNEINSLSGSDYINSIAFSPDGIDLAYGGGDKTIRLWNVQTGQEIKLLKGHVKAVSSVAFSSDRKMLASASEDKTIRLWNVETGLEIGIIEGFRNGVGAVRFLPDGKTLVSGDTDSIKLWDIKTRSLTKSFKTSIYDDDSFTLSPNGKIIASTVFENNEVLKLWNIETGLEMKSIKSNVRGFTTIVFLPDGKTLVLGSNDATIRFWNMESNDPLASLISLDKGDWVVTAPNGRFDTNKLENNQGLIWVMPDAPFTPLSFEVFMRDYYEPNLLPRLLKCTEENNCETEFKPVRNLTALNRTQPKIKISNIKPIAPDEVELVVEAEDEASEFQTDKQNQPLHSGVFDVRLFRDGQLVGYSTSDEKLQNTFRTYTNFDEELKVWQEANKVELVNGKKTFTFQVKLPKNSSAKEFEFSAYAFNLDRVKSETARETYKLEKPLQMAKGNAYIVTIGVNANETAGLKLNYAANDARRLQEELAKNVPPDKYQKVVQIPLISEYDKAGNLGENNATKAKIKDVLDVLAGKKDKVEDLGDVPEAKLLEKVQPEDLVLLAFSGHGYADQNGIFYLVPYDIGKSAAGGLKQMLSKAISSDELSLWLRDVDAGEMMMIVDACHSAAAVQGAGFKPGPMGSRGLGQLSYDKGMRILTATQAANVALELGNLQHGLLTYSLVQNGIELRQADYQPKDNKLFSQEWLGFAVKDVPNLYEKIAKGEIKGLFIDGAKPKSSDLIDLSGNQKSNLNLQQPSLFDFSRRNKLYELIILR